MENPINYWYQKYISLKAEMDKMLKDTMEGEVFIANADYKEAIISVVIENTKLDCLETGDKVKLIIVKEDEK